MTLRGEWQFPIRLEQLREAVAAKQGHHAERLEHWLGQERAAEEDLRANGIDLREAASVGVRNQTAYHQEPVLHPEKVAALREAQAKVREHRQSGEAYGRWGRALALEGAPTLYHLDVDDLAYFGL